MVASARSVVDEFVQSVSAGAPKEVYLLYGEEEFLVDQALEAVLAATLSPAERQFNLDVVHAGDMDIREVLALCASFPMLADRRVVVLRDVESMNARELELLGAYLESPSPSTCLVLIAGSVDMRKKPFHALRKIYPVLECKPLYENQAPRWVEMRAKSAGKRISADAARLLVAYVGTSLRTLDGELGKLYLYTGGRDAIATEDVASVVGLSREFSVFELQRALGMADAPRAVSILEHLLDGGENPSFLLVMLTSYFVTLWKLHELKRKNASPGAIASELRVNPYFLREYLAGAETFTGAEIEEVLCRMAEADAALKSTQPDPRQVMHSLLARLLNGKKTNSQALA